ncbi:MAG TPA: DUF86 domain-containing protein [Thermoanaerobaculia bacterium]|nr:DUF86 domain-containing protein [Thermoanaerobaculia bacterium]
MTPTGIDAKIVVDRLDLLAGYLRSLRALPQATFEEFVSDVRNSAAAESLLRRAIEALLDTTRHILAKGLGIGALEYGRMAELAVENRLVEDAALGSALVQIARYRNRMTHFYDEIKEEELYGIVTERLGDLEGLADELRRAARRLAKGG